MLHCIDIQLKSRIKLPIGFLGQVGLHKDDSVNTPPLIHLGLLQDCPFCAPPSGNDDLNLYKYNRKSITSLML